MLSLRRLTSRASANPIRPDYGPAKTVQWAAHEWLLLQRLIGLPGLWAVQFARLCLFVLAALPALLPLFFSYLLSPQVRKNIMYGPSIRQQLDVYLPGAQPSSDDGRAPAKRPLVVFVTGGAWIIGYKVWPFIQAQVLQRNGVVCVSPDYRNFPQASIPAMVDDLDAALGWVFAHVEQLNVDPANVTLVGQSAGAHLLALLMLRKAKHEAAAPKSRPAGGANADAGATDSAARLPDAQAQRWPPRPWSLAQVRRWVAISGPYELEPLVEQLHARGLDRRLMRALVPDAPAVSPTCHARALSPAAAARVPPVLLAHGMADRTCHWHQTRDFEAALRAAGVHVDAEYYEGKSHTDPILEDPMSGEDPLMLRLLAEIMPQPAPASRMRGAGPEQAGSIKAAAVGRELPSDDSRQCSTAGSASTVGGPKLLPRMLPRLLTAAARWVNPF